MAREKSIDFAKAKKDQTVLEGRVIMVQTHKEVLGDEEPYAVVTCNRKRFTIYENQIEPLPFGQSIEKLIGIIIPFVVLAYDKDSETGIGSNKIAEEKRLLPIKTALKTGKEMDARIVNLLEHGAYLSIGGVRALIRNRDFAENGMTIKEAGFREYQPIKVRYLRETDNGTILVEAVKKLVAEETIQMNELERGQTLVGKVVGVFPERVYVNISRGIDVLCSYPTFIDSIKQGERMRLKLVKVDTENNKVRGIIIDAPDR